MIDIEGIENVPIEILHRDTDTILNYLTQKVKSRTIEIYEAKLLIVGAGNVGKTCLKNRLLSLDVHDNQETTMGIDIYNWVTKTEKSDNFKINIWDFGGQEIYHATHQFFLTRRSLYLFVWDPRSDDDVIHFDYWLNIIKLLSDNSPVMVIQNKIDDRVKNIEETYLKSYFRNIAGFFKVSALKDTNIEYLKKQIREQIDILPHIGNEVPEVWDDIGKKIKHLEENYLSYTKYLDTLLSG